MNKNYNSTHYKVFEIVLMVIAGIAAVILLIPALNPARITSLINDVSSLLTLASSYTKLISKAIRPFRLGWVSEGSFIILYVGAVLTTLSIFALAVGSAISIGNIKFKKLSQKINLGSSIGLLLGTVFIFISYNMMSQSRFTDRIHPVLPLTAYLFLVMAVIALGLTIYLMVVTPQVPEEENEYKMDRPSQLLLMYLPFAILIFVFSYMPLWGWRLAFFDYEPGKPLTLDSFVGLKWFKFLYKDPAIRSDIGRVMVNTLAMSGLGILTSWLPMFFAMFLAEATSSKFKRFVQTFTTIPNFISWVLVYALALAIFSTDGFINGFIMKMGWANTTTNYLQGDRFIWLKMWAWGTWKGLGWSAIIYVAAISSIDPQMYESAAIDGANRWQKMWYITLPSLLPTYFVLLILSVASILSNGMDQYLVFENASNTGRITVLDLYVYQLGIGGGNYSLSTVVGMLKSVISITLLLGVNTFSKVVRKESIF